MAKVKMILISLSILYFFIQGVYGISISVTGGNANSGLGATTTFAAGLDDVVEQHIVLNTDQGKMSNHLHADGPVTGFRQVRGKSGGYADAGFSVTGRYAQTDYEFTMSNNPYALVTESLTSQIADNIYVFANAKDFKGEWAKAEMYVDSPSRYSINKANLVGYFVSAYATSDSASVEQKATRAAAPEGKILINLAARERSFDKSYVKSILKSLYTPYPYYSNMKACAYASFGKTKATQSFYALGPISSESYASLNGVSTRDVDSYLGKRIVVQNAWTDGFLNRKGAINAVRN
ncbi:MAG: hypothetical protein WCW68_08435 [Methanothrix sp.]